MGVRRRGPVATDERRFAGVGRNQTAGEQYDWFGPLGSVVGDDPEEVADVNCSSRKWDMICEHVAERQRAGSTSSVGGWLLHLPPR